MTGPDHAHSRAHFVEFVALMGFMMSLVALSLDAMLPALSEIGADLGVTRANDNQLIVSLLLLGMALGQIIYGPLADSLGRRPAIFAGLGLFIAGCLVSFLAQSLPVMLVGRVMQGVGAAGPRVVAIALIRDQYEGRAMARVMSFVMAVFIIVPIIAPALGQAILLVASWRAIFGLFLSLAIVVAIWFGLRQPETLAKDQRIPLSLGRVASVFGEVVATQTTLRYTVAAGLIFGAFVGYLSTAQQIFQEQYRLGKMFPLYFALLSVAIGMASLVNARLVLKYGMRPLSQLALVVIASLSIGFVFFAYASAGHPPLWTLVTYLLMVFFCNGLLYANMNALAMEPVGHIAGVGAAVVGALSMFISIVCGTVIGQAYDGTVLPLAAGFGLLSVAAFALVRSTESETGVEAHEPV